MPIPELLLLTVVIWLLLVFTLAIAFPRVRLGPSAAALGLSAAVALVLLADPRRPEPSPGDPQPVGNRPRAILASALQVPTIPAEAKAVLEANGYQVTYRYKQQLLKTSIRMHGEQPVVEELRRVVPGAVVVQDPELPADVVVRIGLGTSVGGRSILLLGPTESLEALRRRLERLGVEAEIRASPPQSETHLFPGPGAGTAEGLELTSLVRAILGCGSIQDEAPNVLDFLGTSHQAAVWVGLDVLNASDSCSPRGPSPA